MIDTIKMFKFVGDVPIGDVTKNLHHIGACQGWYLGENIRVYPLERINGVVVGLEGSLSRYYKGCNAYTLTRKECEQALTQLFDELGFDMWDADITRVDVAACIPMKNDVSSYYSFLGHRPYFKRSEFKSMKNHVDGVTYSVQPEQLLFYDKLKEIKRKVGWEKYLPAEVLPEEFYGKNLMRMEMRLVDGVARRLGWAQVTPLALVDRGNYTQLVSRWGQAYFDIQKIGGTNMELLGKANTPANAKDVLLAMLLNKVDNKDAVIESYLNDLKAADAMGNRKAYQRLSSELKRLIQMGDYSNAEVSKLIIELNEKVSMLMENAR